MMRRSRWNLSLALGMSALALSACDPAAWDQGEAPEDISTARTACIDPATGELISPGPDVECSVPPQAATGEAPVVRDLEGGGKAIDLKGRGQQNQVKPAGQNRMAVVDPETGELLSSRPDDALAAARYDRSIARARSMMKRQAGPATAETAKDVLILEPLPTGGIKIDVKGRFQVPLVATLSKDGQVHLQHEHR